MIDLSRINSYSVEELAEGLRSGEYTFEDYQKAYLHWQKQAALRVIQEEIRDWENAVSQNTLEAYQKYVQKWSAQDKKDTAKHLDEANAKIQMLLAEIMRQEEEQDWNNATAQNTLEAYQKYKQKWSEPDKRSYALHLSEAENQIRTLLAQRMMEEEARDWNNALAYDSEQAFNNYKYKWSAPDRKDYAVHLSEVDRKIWEIRNRIILREEKRDWEAADRTNTKASYTVYINKWSAADKEEFGLHLADARARLESIIAQEVQDRKEMLQGLLLDMKVNPWRYRQDLLRLLFYGNPNESQTRFMRERGSQLPYAKFVLEGNKLEMEDLYDAGVVPNNFTIEELLAPDYTMPATQIQNMGVMPNDRTDVYFFGVPRSGKSSVLSGIIYKLWKDGLADYVPQIVDGRDMSGTYYRGLIESISSKKPPQGTAVDTVSFMKINIRNSDGKRKHPVTIVELSGEAFQQMSERFVNPTQIWNQLGASQCLANNNPKLLFFVLDYSIISNKNPENMTSATRQIMTLETALRVFTHDGPDPNKPTEGCTMSKVDTVAVIMTKCDLMNAHNHQQRLNLAEEYILQNFQSFMRDLMDICQKNGINAANKYRPYILAFSLGKFYVGNTVVFNHEDPKKIIDFIAKVTRGVDTRSWWQKFLDLFF